jgi:hypothetical protein
MDVGFLQYFVFLLIASLRLHLANSSILKTQPTNSAYASNDPCHEFRMSERPQIRIKANPKCPRGWISYVVLTLTSLARRIPERRPMAMIQLMLLGLPMSIGVRESKVKDCFYIFYLDHYGLSSELTPMLFFNSFLPISRR